MSINLLFAVAAIIQSALPLAGADQPRIIVKPKELYQVPLNSTIKLPCRVSVLPHLTVNWLKNGFGMGDNRRQITSFNKRYDLPDNTGEGQYDLQIRNIRLSDDGLYRCQATSQGAPVLSNFARIFVLVPSKAPFLRQVMADGKKQVLTETKKPWVREGKTLKLECVAQHGRPGATLRWRINFKELELKKKEKIWNFEYGTVHGTITNTTTKEKKLKKLTTVVSQLTATINKIHHGHHITCIAMNEGYNDLPHPVVSTQVVVRYKPIVMIRISPARPNNTYEEFESIEIRCDADGRPSKFYWQWFFVKNGRKRQIKGIEESFYKIRVNRSMHLQTFKCIAYNDDPGWAQVTIRVKYPPRFTNPRPTLYSAGIGGQVTMRCNVDSNPKPLVEWFKKGSNIPLQRSTVYTRKNIQQIDFGQYICRASADKFSTIEKPIYLEMRGRPIIRRNFLSYGIKGRTGKVLCYVTSIPKPKMRDILWFRNGKRIKNIGRYSMKQTPILRGVKAYLFISRLMPSDYGAYNCTVTNTVGRDTAIVTLLPQETMSVAFICGAAIAVTVTLVVIIIILCLCRKNSARRRLYKQAGQRQAKSMNANQNHDGKTVEEQELVYRPTATVSVTGAATLEAPWRNKDATVACSTAHHLPYLPHPPHHVATTTAGLTHTLGRYDFDERSYLRNGSILRYKGIDLSPPPSAIHTTIVEEDEAYKEDSARSYDSGYSPGPAFTNLFNVPISSTAVASTCAQHGLLLPTHSNTLSYVPVSSTTPNSAGQRAYATLPSGGGVVNCHSTNV